LTHGKKDVKEMIFFIDPILAWIKEQLADPEIAVIVFEARAQVRVKTRCELADGTRKLFVYGFKPKRCF